MKTRLLTIVLSLILLPALAATGITETYLPSNELEAVTQVNTSEQSDICLTACCYVTWTRTTDPQGNPKCVNGGSTHCSSCCSTGLCVPGESD